MAVLDYTTYADIRAILGVSDAELDDVTLGLEVYSSNLSKEFRGIHAQLVSQYALVKALDEADRSEQQQVFYETTRLFAVYAVGKQLSSGLPMFGPKDVSDSKASMSRFSDSPYKETMREIKDQYTTLKLALADCIGTLLAGSVSRRPRTFMAVASPTTDPVIE